MTTAADAFIRAASVPFDAHASGTLDEAERLCAAHPSVTAANVNAAAVAGNDVAVRGFLAQDATSATRNGGPHGWDPLTYLCFSRYLPFAAPAIEGVRSDCGGPARRRGEPEHRVVRLGS